MPRGKVVVLVAAVIVGMCAAAGVLLISTAVDNDAADDPRPVGRPDTHGASELRSPDTGDLPAAEAATRRFLRGYLPLITGRPGATPDDLQAATPEVIQQLRASDVRAPAAQQNKRFRVLNVAVAFGATRQVATASVQVKGPDTPAFLMTLRLERIAGAWKVARLTDR